LETQLEIALEIGAGHIETVCSFNLGLTEYSLGLPEEGLRRIAHAVKLSRKLKMVRYTAHALLAEAVCWEDDDRAEQCAENSLTLFRQVQDRGGEAMALLCRGRVAVRRGETEKAMSILENAAELAREVSLPQVKAHALACRATLPGGDAARAAKVLAAEAQHIGVLTSMDAHFLLWQATRDEAHLKEAHRLLRELRDHAPEDCRDSMIRNVPLHREIMRAWEEQGGD
jgi:tetratricopeptide (TPR) repeat protein